MEVLPNEIIIRAPGVEGLFYGMQTLRQLFPASIENPVPVAGDVEWKIPCLRIVDGPRFLWRGLMLDVSRTFMKKNLVKRYIDMLAFYKMNRLHWHLTDDQGWRIEIRKYPELTRVGSKFAEKYNEMGGYYTQAEAQEIVAYAAERNVVVVPEIEMPGHSLAALAAYAGLSCTGEALSIHPFLKGPNIHEEVFCAGNEKVYEFLVFMVRSLYCLAFLGFLFAFGLGFGRFLSESQEPPAETKLQTGPGIGQRIPNFQGIDQNGRQQTFGSIRGPRGALIVFYRSADW